MNRKQKLITGVLIILLIVFGTFSLTQGRYRIELNILVNWVSSSVGFTNIKFYSEEQNLILANIRLPRIILVSLVGSSLAVSGAVLQSVFKNPLVSPFILGVSAGASFGVAIVIFIFNLYDIYLLQTSAFLFGMIAVLSVLLISKLFSSTNTIVLILSGVIISSFFSSIVSLLQYFADDQKLQSILFWTFGSFTNASWQSIAIVAPINLICSIILVAQSWKINVLSLGEQESQILGIDSNRMTLWMIAVTTLLTSSVTAICGPIGWVGLIIPHVVRLLGGSNNFYVIINSFLLGAFFLVFVDFMARNVAFIEIPVGIITALIGLPFFIVILYKCRTAYSKI